MPTEVKAIQQHQGEREASIRRRLGIPPDAKQVVFFPESSHWDPDWRFTSQKYFSWLVRRNLDNALDQLQKEPGRVYSIECMFFLRMYWDACPDKRETIVNLVNEGRLRLTNSGVTTADTMIPRTESLLRDFLAGQEWLRKNGMTQEPSLAYFPDSFGHSPALPSLLRSAGFQYTAVTRIDGMFYPGADIELPRNFPRPGSSAELLMNRERTLDFIWRGPDGGEVMCHWNAFTYSQGDMLSYRGIARVYIFPTSFPDRSERNVASKIGRFTARLAACSRTPYLCCPIGGDFVGPIPGLAALLDRYNRTRYASTGIWALNAGMDDYLSLVDCHRESLPVLELDPNPYWTGFYSSRPTLKARCHKAADMLGLAEAVSLLPQNRGAEKTIGAEMEDAWWHISVSNHHDFITGTSPDSVVEIEQGPWMEKAAGTAKASISKMKGYQVAAPAAVGGVPPEYKREGGIIEVRTRYYVLKLDERSGGCIVDAFCPDTQRKLLSGISNDLVSYKDRGGLWRMGHEFKGGMFKEDGRASDRPAHLDCYERDGGLEISCAANLDGCDIIRRMQFRWDSPLISMSVEGMAARGRTVCVRYETGLSPDTLSMDVPGGVVVRPLKKWYDPTFWLAQRFVHAQDRTSGSGIAVLAALPMAVSCGTHGRMELVALRNALREKLYGVIPISAMPVTGRENSSFKFNYTLLFTASGGWRENGVDILSTAHAMSDDDGTGSLRALVKELVTTDDEGVTVTAVKPASRGEGVIVRLTTYTGAGSPLSIRMQKCKVIDAYLCDARERDLNRLDIEEGVVRLIMPGNIATVRLICS